MRSDNERLSDMIEAGEKIAERVARGRAAFDGNEDVQLALVRLLEIIGEAAAGLSAEFRAQHPDIPWRLIVGMRGRIVHRYLDIDHDVLWQTASDDVPSLLERIRRIQTEGGW